MPFPTRKAVLVGGTLFAGILSLLSAPATSAGTVGAPRPQTTSITGSASGAALLQVLNTGTGGGIIGQVGSSAISAASGAGLYGVFNPSSGTGEGILGFASNGSGIVGETFGGVYAAVYAQNYSASAAPAMQAVSNGNSVVGTSADSNSIVGITNDPTNGGATAAGVFGEDGTSATYISNNDGVLGTTLSGDWGVQGTSSNSALGGVEGSGTNGYGVRGISGSNFGVYGSSTSSDGGHFISSSLSGAYAESTTGAGLYGQNNGSSTSGVSDGVDVGVYAVSSVGNAVYATTGNFVGSYFTNDSGTFDTMVVNAQGASSPLVLEASGGTTTFASNGNLTVPGEVIASGGFTTANSRNPGTDMMTYSTQEAESTIEDVGSAHLLRGAASVALASDFRQTIDGSSQYMVFLTPYGDTRGLYVSQRGPQGFVVRENGGGTSTVDFDYRIVARPYGGRLARLPHLSSVVHQSLNHDGGRPSRAAIARLLARDPLARDPRAMQQRFAINHIPRGAPLAAQAVSRQLRLK